MEESPPPEEARGRGRKKFRSYRPLSVFDQKKPPNTVLSLPLLNRSMDIGRVFGGDSQEPVRIREQRLGLARCLKHGIEGTHSPGPGNRNRDTCRRNFPPLRRT